jgi:hypothetical protein
LYFYLVIYDARIHNYQISLSVCPLRLSHGFPQSIDITELGQKMTLPVKFYIPLVFFKPSDWQIKKHSYQALKINLLLIEDNSK